VGGGGVGGVVWWLGVGCRCAGGGWWGGGGGGGRGVVVMYISILDHTHTTGNKSSSQNQFYAGSEFKVYLWFGHILYH